jgi:hypothetical protein
MNAKTTAGITVVNRASTLVAWFPAKWASKIATVFMEGPRPDGLAAQVSTVIIQSVQSARDTSEDSQEPVAGSLCHAIS